MKSYYFNKEGKKGGYHVFEYGNYEFKNPIDILEEIVSTSSIRSDIKYFELKQVPFSFELFDLMFRSAKKSMDDFFSKIIECDVPDSLDLLLQNPKKKDQIKLLKEITFDFNSLHAFFNKYNYTLSHYRFEYLATGTDSKSLPSVIDTSNNKVKIVGKTKLSEAQLKQVVDHRKVLNAKFLDNGENWHCFFITDNSLKGLEAFDNGQPHFHYISNKWNYSRSEVIEKLNQNWYGLSGLPHIPYLKEK